MLPDASTLEVSIVGGAEPQRPEEGSDVVDQEVGLLQRRKMPALWHYGVAGAGEDNAAPRPRRRGGARAGEEGGEAGRRLDPRALGQATVLLLSDAAIEPRRRARRAGQP